jgi:hypothetical protein
MAGESAGPDRAPASPPSLIRNWASLAGIILAMASFFAVACLIAIDLFRGMTNPYVGILTYIVAPAFLIVGLLLILAGALWERRRRRRLEPGAVAALPRIDLNVPRQRHAFVVVAAATATFLLLTALGSYRTYQFTESVGFCGTTCHSIMRPEYDEASSPWTIRLLVKIGGGDPSFGPVGGIHWHMYIADRIEYIHTGRERQVIPWVRMTDQRGTVTVFQARDKPLTPAQVAAARPRVMDCTDCHNRPTLVGGTATRSS